MDEANGDACAEDVHARIWPELPDGCPCSGAAAAARVFYRLSDPNDPNDWAPQATWRSAEWFAGLKDDDARCRALGVSIFGTQDAMSRLLRRAGRFSGHSVIEFRVESDMGVVLAGEREHYTWWPSENVEPPIAGRVMP